MVNETNKDIILENMVETEVELANPPTDGSSVSVLADPDPEDTVEAYISTYEIGRGWDMEDKLEYSIRDIEDAVASLQTDKADVIHTHDGYASSTHTHDGYVSSSDLEALEDVVDAKADLSHTHSEYSLTNHVHDGYATQIALDTLSDEVDGKADSTHSHSEYALTSHEHDYAPSNHNHDSDYAPLSHSHSGYVTTTDFDALETVVNGKANESHIHSNYAEVSHTHDDYASSTHTHTASEIGAAVSGHNHDSDYASIDHNHNSSYATVGHDHDEDYSAIDHVHSDYATVTSLNEISTIVSGKANASHSHNDTYYTETEIDTKLSGKSDTSHTHTGIYDASGSATSALASAKEYTDSKIDALVGEGASTTLDTIGEISSAIEDNQDAIDLLNSAIANKANASDLTSHTGNATIHVTETNKNNWGTAYTHSQSAHAPSNAEANQNAFSNVAVGNTTISADTKTDTLTLVAGNNVTLTPSAENDSITISAVDTVYTHPTSSGNKHIPAGGSSGQILRWSADGTAVWGADNNTIYSNATQTSAGLMSDTDKTKLDGIAVGANNYTLPSAGTSLGGVKTGGDVTISSGVITVNDDSHNHVISNVDGLQSVLDGKASSSHNHDDVYYTETEVDTLLSGKANSTHTHTIANVSGLQSALDGKAATSHGTHVSYSTTAPVMDGTASVGTASTVARSDHKHPTDTSRAAKTELDALATTVSGKANASHTHTIANITNLQTTLDGKAASGHTHSAATSSAAGLMSASDKSKLDGIASGANAYTLPTASSTLGGVKTTSTVTSNSGYTACPIISGVPYYKDTNTTYNLSSFGVTATAAELNYVDGVTSNIQTQLNGKASSSHTHSYAGSSSAGGAATSANKLNTNAGSATQPVYFANGIPVKTTYTLGASVPSGAKFTDTTYGVATTSANGLMSASDKSKLDGMVLATVSEVETYLGI